MIGRVYRMSNQSLTLMGQAVYETKGAIKHEFPLKKWNYVHTLLVFFSFFEGGFFLHYKHSYHLFFKKEKFV